MALRKTTPTMTAGVMSLRLFTRLLAYILLVSLHPTLAQQHVEDQNEISTSSCSFSGKVLEDVETDSSNRLVNQHALEEDFDQDDEEEEEELEEYDVQGELRRRKLVDGRIATFSKEEEPFFLVPSNLAPGDMAPFVWREDGIQVCPFGQFVGLPHELTTEMYTFVKDTGLLHLFRELAYESRLQRKEHRLFLLNGGREYIAMNAGGNGTNWGDSDLHWVDAADERGFEEVLQVLKRGKLDQVLNSIGEYFDSESLAVTGVGFVAATRSRNATDHADNTGSQENFFNLMFPLILPNDYNSTLHVGGIGRDLVGNGGGEYRLGPVKMRQDAGILLSGDTAHMTSDFDYRSKRQFRVFVSVYIANIKNDKIKKIVAGDGTAYFPPAGMEEWVGAQKGRHWGNEQSLINDVGRQPLAVQDSLSSENCLQRAKQGKCKSDLKGTRMSCLKTCKVLFSDDEYNSKLFPLSQEAPQLIDAWGMKGFERRGELRRRELVDGSIQTFSKEEEPFFLVPKALRAGEMAPFVWREDEQQVCPYGNFVGLPPELSTEMHSFVEESGLSEIFWGLTYEGILPSGKGKLFQVHNGREYIAISTSYGGNWEGCDLYWIDTADERGYEEALRVLERGNFDQVLDSIGQYFQSDSLAVTGLGFMTATHCKSAKAHTDNPGSEENFFNLVFPLLLPEDDVASLNLGGTSKNNHSGVDGDFHLGSVQMRPDVGLLLSGDTTHQTTDFDFRASQELRVFVSVYVADLKNTGIEKIVAGDGTAFFPPKGKVEWVEAQKGRHWGNGASLANDMGRSELDVEDELGPELCSVLKKTGKCNSDLDETRMSCLRTCKVLIDDNEYGSTYFRKNPNKIKDRMESTTEEIIQNTTVHEALTELRRRKLVDGRIPSVESEDEPYFLVPEVLHDGEMAPFVWREDGKVNSLYSQFVGLPFGLSGALQEVALEDGLYDLFEMLAYDKVLSENEQRMYMTAEGQAYMASKKNQAKGSCDFFRVEEANEVGFEKILQVLRLAGFDSLLDSIGSNFGSESLAVTAVSFLSATHCQDDNEHRVFPGSRGDVFDLIFPILLPSEDISILSLSGESGNGPIRFHPGIGILLSGDTSYRMSDFDFRGNAVGLGVLVSIQIADLQKSGVKDAISGDWFAKYLPRGTGPWLETQQGRHWGRTGKSLALDTGRRALVVEDEFDSEICQERLDHGKCKTDLGGTRMMCLKTCNVILKDDDYYSFFATNSAENGKAEDDYEEIEEHEVQGELRRRMLVDGRIPSLSEDEEHFFLVPREMESGEMSPFVWRSDGLQVCNYGQFVGLPSELTTEMYNFVDKAGLLDLFNQLAYQNTLSREEERLFEMKDGREYVAIRTGGDQSNWGKSDLQWIDTADERGYEEVLQVLQRGKFDKILDSIGLYFGSESLAVTGVGFMVATHCREASQHRDNPGAGQDFFNLVFPLILPQKNTARLHIGGIARDLIGDAGGEYRLGPVKMRENIGLLLSGDTFHKTSDFDFRPDHELRVFVSVYVANIKNEKIKKIVAGDGTAYFPPKGMTEWVGAQRGRHWGSGHSLENDPGRRPLSVRDTLGTEKCAQLASEGKCKSDLQKTRMMCLKTCKVLIDDGEYFSSVAFNSTKHHLMEMTELPRIADHLDSTLHAKAISN